MSEVREIIDRIMNSTFGKEVEAHEKIHESETCPDCGSQIVPSEGCAFCPSCGWSPCK